MIFPLVIEGLSVGSVYALVAVGLVLVSQATGTLNFTHGDFMMFSTFVAYALLVQLHLPFLVAVAGSLAFGVLVGLIAERLVIRHLIGRPMAASIMATLGMAFLLQGTAKNIWTDDVFRFPEFFPGDFIQIGTARLSPQNLGVIISTMVIISILYLFLNRTRIGTGLRALTQNREAATLMGVRVTRMYSLAWGLGGALAAIAGILLAPALFLSTSMGGITFTGIIAAIIGGFGNLFGAIIGGYLLGIFSSVVPLFIPTELQGIIPFVLLMVVVFIRPTGIIGRRTVNKV